MAMAIVTEPKELGTRLAFCITDGKGVYCRFGAGLSVGWTSEGVTMPC